MCQDFGDVFGVWGACASGSADPVVESLQRGLPLFVSFCTYVPADRSVGTGMGRRRGALGWTKVGRSVLGPLVPRPCPWPPRRLGCNAAVSALVAAGQATERCC